MFLCRRPLSLRVLCSGHPTRHGVVDMTERTPHFTRPASCGYSTAFDRSACLFVHQFQAALAYAQTLGYLTIHG